MVEKLNVKILVISKQVEQSEECSKMLELAKKNNVRIIIVEAGQTLKLESSVSFSILWPDSKNLISENALNNNSIVAKLKYGKFQMLFTGDIEQIAEEKIVEKYGDKLKSTILKIAHHGSNTSSIENFINAVKPEVVLIGVGKNNKYGHPNQDVINRLKKYGAKIYRTDESGEICMKINKNGKIANNIHR